MTPTNDQLPATPMPAATHTERLREALAGLERERLNLIAQLGEALLARCQTDEVLYQEYAVLVDALGRIDEGRVSLETSISLLEAFEVQQQALQGMEGMAGLEAVAPVVAEPLADVEPFVAPEVAPVDVPVDVPEAEPAAPAADVWEEPAGETGGAQALCPACGAPVSPADVFCMSCGAPLTQQELEATWDAAAGLVGAQAIMEGAEAPVMSQVEPPVEPLGVAEVADMPVRATCPECGSPVSPADVFCMSCGAALTAEATAANVVAVATTPVAVEGTGTPAPDMAPELSCPVCGAPYQAGDLFCMGCGTPLGATVVAHEPIPFAGPTCPACGMPVSAGDAFCMSCGTRLDQVAPVAAPASRRRFCHECGKPLGPADQFCMWCGTPAPIDEE